MNAIFKKMDDLVTSIDKDRDEMIMAKPHKPIKVANISDNQRVYDILKGCADATEEEFKHAVKLSPDDASKGYVLLLIS